MTADRRCTLRPAAMSDMAACAWILNHWIDATPWMPRVHPDDDVERYFREYLFPDQEVIVAETDQGVAGFLALSRDSMISQFYLAGEFRNRRLGHRLLSEAKRKRPDGLRLWTFVANTGARRFYEREGFVEQGRTDGDNEEKLPDILYRWPGEEGRP